MPTDNVTGRVDSPAHCRLRTERRLIYERWWLDERFRYGLATFHPRGMTADELTAGCYRARSDFNSVRSILRRLLDRRTNLASPYRAGLYLASNFVSRHEIHKKQGSRLGTRPVDRVLSGTA